MSFEYFKQTFISSHSHNSVFNCIFLLFYCNFPWTSVRIIYLQSISKEFLILTLISVVDLLLQYPWMRMKLVWSNYNCVCQNMLVPAIIQPLFWQRAAQLIPGLSQTNISRLVIHKPLFVVNYCLRYVLVWELKCCCIYDFSSGIFSCGKLYSAVPCNFVITWNHNCIKRKV